MRNVLSEEFLQPHALADTNRSYRWWA